MASRIRLQCPNCLTPYPTIRARFCAACGRARDEKSDAEMAAPALEDPNRSRMLVTTAHRPRTLSPNRQSTRPASPRNASRPDDQPALALPEIRPGTVAIVAIVFFGLVGIGRWINAPQKPTHPIVAPLAIATPDPAEARKTQRQWEAREKRDLRQAEIYSGDLRAEAAAEHLRDQLRYSQPPPSNDPKSFDIVPVHPMNNGVAVQTDSQGQFYGQR